MSTVWVHVPEGLFRAQGRGSGFFLQVQAGFGFRIHILLI